MADPYAIKPEPGTGRSVKRGSPWPAHIPRRVPTLLQAIPKLVTASWLKVRNDEEEGAYEQVRYQGCSIIIWAGNREL